MTTDFHSLPPEVSTPPPPVNAAPERKKNSVLKYTFISLLVTLLLPAALMVTMHVFAKLESLTHVWNFGWEVMSYLRLGLAALVILGSGWLLAKKAPLPASFFWRYLPLISPFLIILLASIPHMLLTHSSYRGLGPGLLALLVPIVYVPYILAFAVGTWKNFGTNKLKGLAGLSLLLVVAGGAAVGTWHYEFRNTLFNHTEPASVGHGVETWRYLPFRADNNNLLTKPATPPSLRISANHPRLDGAIAVLPLYGAVAQALYENIDTRQSGRSPVDCTNTQEAYKRLTDGDIDIFFGAEPSKEQIAYAREKGAEFTMTPIAREAFVFFVHKDNPTTTLTQKQIRDIYTRRVSSWSQLGGADSSILPFQRPKNSGSQTIMEQQVMKGETMIKPVDEEFQSGMGDTINRVAAYRNRLNALGYSFRWYATVQYSNPDIKLLAVDGVLPTVENIRNGAYPFIGPVVAVTARPLSPESRQLLDWLAGPEGQALIERTGYVPLK